MANNLASAIDAAVSYISDRLAPLSESEVAEFERLGDTVYELSFKANLLEALPKQDDLRYELESPVPDMKPVTFISKLNLPGDWDNNGDHPPQYVFSPCPPPRWFSDMQMLRSLATGSEPANSKPRRRTGKPRKDETSGDAKIIAGIKSLLQSRGQDDPPTGRAIAAASDVANVSRFIIRHWKSQKEFAAAWRRGDVMGKLARLEYKPERHAQLRSDE
jgi:hypothetical protein